MANYLLGLMDTLKMMLIILARSPKNRAWVLENGFFIGIWGWDIDITKYLSILGLDNYIFNNFS